jgi:PE family
MSFVSVTPDIVGQAAGELGSIGSTLSAANAAAAASTTGIVAPGADAVSAAVAALLGAHAEEYQAIGAQAADFHSQFVSLLNAGTGSYVSTELANARATAALGLGGLGGLGGGSGGVLSYLTGSIPGVPELELAAVAAGPAVVALPALEHQTGFVNALQTGNLGAATAALTSPVVQQAALYGQQTVSVPLPGSVTGVQHVALNVPFGGVLAPVQPVTVSVTSTGSPPITVPIPGLQTGGLIPWLQADGPDLLLSLALFAL